MRQGMPAMPPAGAPAGGAPQPPPAGGPPAGGAPPGGDGLGGLISQILGQQVSQSGTDPAETINQLRNFGMGISSIMPHYAFKDEEVSKELSAASRSIQNAIKNIEKQQARATLAAQPIQNAAANTGGAAGPPIFGSLPATQLAR